MRGTTVTTEATAVTKRVQATSKELRRRAVIYWQPRYSLDREEGLLKLLLVVGSRPASSPCHASAAPSTEADLTARLGPDSPLGDARPTATSPTQCSTHISTARSSRRGRSRCPGQGQVVPPVLPVLQARPRSRSLSPRRRLPVHLVERTDPSVVNKFRRQPPSYDAEARACAARSVPSTTTDDNRLGPVRSAHSTDASPCRHIISVPSSDENSSQRATHAGLGSSRDLPPKSPGFCPTPRKREKPQRFFQSAVAFPLLVVRLAQRVTASGSPSSPKQQPRRWRWRLDNGHPWEY